MTTKKTGPTSPPTTSDKVATTLTTGSHTKEAKHAKRKKAGEGAGGLGEAAPENCSPCGDLTAATSSPHSHASSFLTDLVWIAFWTVVLGSLLSAPHWLWVIAHWNDSTTPVRVGTVQSIHFIGDWGIKTQIDTEDRSFVVHGMTRLQRGSRIEQRKTRDSVQLCAVDDARTALHCEDLVRQ